MEMKNNHIDIKAHLIKAMGNEKSGEEVYNHVQKAMVEILTKADKFESLEYSESNKKRFIETEICIAVAQTIQLCNRNNANRLNELMTNLDKIMESDLVNKKD